MSGALSYPSAATVALALVAAAREKDELHLLRRSPEAYLQGVIGGLQAPWYVLAALDAAYPRIDLPRMARWVGCTAHIYTVEIGKRRRHRNWDLALEHAIFLLVAP